MKWIDVKDRLPNYQETVLLYISNSKGDKKYVTIGHRTYTDVDGDHYEQSGYKDWNVELWMLLPYPKT